MAVGRIGRIGWIINRNSLVAMNERLEIEIARYSGQISPDKAKNQPFATLDKCARYFYKLALEDVREKVEEFDEKYRTMRVDKDVSVQVAKEADLVVHVLQELGVSIDNLTK